jgi:SAM-dependent methyltransferase
MIHVARRKFPRGRFITGDAAAIRLNRKFDLVLLLFDSANHMNSLSHLLRVFRNARRHLKPGGHFVFDFLTDRGLEEWEQLNIRREKNYTLLCYGHYYEGKMLADIFIEAFVKRGRHYQRVFQKIVEKTYPTSDIIRGLMNCGFEKIAASPFDCSEEIGRAGRLWFVCS